MKHWQVVRLFTENLRFLLSSSMVVLYVRHALIVVFWAHQWFVFVKWCLLGASVSVLVDCGTCVLSLSNDCVGQLFGMISDCVG